MKEYIYDMIDLRNSLDKVWDELTATEVKIGCLFHWKEANT